MKPMNLLSSTPQSGPAVPFLSLAAPWLLQGVILICTTHGHPPFFGSTSAGSDDYAGGSGPISGTAVYLIELSIWMGTLFLLLPVKLSVGIPSKDSLMHLALPILAIVSVGWSTAPKYTAGGSLDLLMLTITAIFVGLAFRPEQQMQIIMLAGTIAAVASVLLAGFFPSEGLDVSAHMGAFKGIFTQKNGCGFYMALFATPVFFIRRTMKIKRLIVWSYGGLCILIVLLSQSRASWNDVLLICVLAVSLKILRTLYWKDRVAVALIGCLATVAFSYIVIVNADTILAVIGKDPSLSGRTLIWQAAFEAISKRPLLGYGYAAFFSSLSAGAGTFVPTTHFVVNHTHDGYLMVWINLGLLGLTLFFMCVVNAIKNAWSAWRQNPSTDWYICLIVVILVENVAEVGIAIPNDLSWLLFVIACTGLQKAAHARARQDHSRVEEFLPSLRVA